MSIAVLHDRCKMRIPLVALISVPVSERQSRDDWPR
jgi:hypothetical protein